MSKKIYTRLALTNIKNNRKTYVPYILTSVLTVVMLFIMHGLARNDSVGEGKIAQILMMSCVVILIFAAIFLFYTNSFLIKRRKKEIGIYNILCSFLLLLFCFLCRQPYSYVITQSYVLM